MANGDDRQWHLDKRVPIALIFAIMMQTAAAVWWAAGISERMNQIERRQEVAGARSENQDELLARQGQRIAVLTEAIANTNRNLERLNGEVGNTNELLRQFLLNHNGLNGDAK